MQRSIHLFVHLHGNYKNEDFCLKLSQEEALQYKRF
jgi:hypothetical protein